MSASQEQSAAREALYRGDPARALALLEGAGGDASVSVLLDRAVALRLLGQVTEALAAIEAALVREPGNFLALLSKGDLLERLSQPRAATAVYKAAIAMAPPDASLPAGLRKALERAREVVARSADDLAEHLRASVEDVRARFAEEDLERFDESLEIFAGRTRAHVQAPALLHYPRLPAIPFYDRGLFPWLGELEAATSVIGEEFLALGDQAAAAFAPYVAFPPGVPVNQWDELNHSTRWSSFFLWRNGARQEGACALCPRTAEILAGLPMADQPGHAPTAMFSRLDARTRIPPHTGSTNVRLLTHLPLILPGPAFFRVGNETRPWRMGEAWVFDDTIEHEAWNDADSRRAILIFDIWNPFLNEAERELV
ncbi:MAG: aspartyl/asparaginyl beta-hydroxylase domain-containing protein, partial [Caulobacteraceae bacterium]|nr:aspartyl/asparaginyl beta-hydroxylase domain-containing protein [Caulobacteraceae bacterium]